MTTTTRTRTMPDTPARAILAVGGLNLSSLDPDAQERVAGFWGALVPALHPDQDLQVLIDSNPLDGHAVVRDLRAQLRPPTPALDAFGHAWLDGWGAALADYHSPDLRVSLAIGPEPQARNDSKAPEAVRLARAVTTIEQIALRTGVSVARSATGCVTIGAVIEHRDAIETADHWARSVYIVAPPSATDPGWLDALIGLNTPCSIALHLKGLDQARERTRLKTRGRFIDDVTLDAKRSGKRLDVDAAGAADEAADQARTMRQGRLAFGRVGVYITIYAPTQTMLEQRTAHLLHVLDDMGCKPGYGLCHQLPLYRSTRLGARDEARSSYRWDSVTWGHALPMTRHSPGTVKGYPLGFTAEGRELVRIDLADPALRNRLLDILGQAGRGKSVLAQKLAAWFLLTGGHVTVVDNASGYGPLCALANGSTIALGGPRTAALNMWEGPRDTPQAYASKVEFVAACHEMLLTRSTGALDDYEYAVVEEGIHVVYTAHSGAEDATAPLEREFVAWLERKAATEAHADDAHQIRRMAIRLRPYINDGLHAAMVDRPTSVDLDARLLVFDLADLKEGSPVRAFAMLAVTELANRRARTARAHSTAAGSSTLDNLLLIEEGWWMLKHGGAREWVNTLGRKGRHSGITPAFISQQLSDLTDDPAAAGYFNQASLHLIFGIEDSSERDGTNPRAWLASKLKLTDHEVGQIERLAGVKGSYAQLFMIRGDRDAARTARGVVNVPLSTEEAWLYASDPDERQTRDRMVVACGGDMWQAVQRLARGERV